VPATNAIGSVATAPQTAFSGAAAATATLEETGARTEVRATPELPPERVLDEPIEELSAEEELAASDEVAAAGVDTRTIAEEPVDDAPPATQYLPPPFAEEPIPEPPADLATELPPPPPAPEAPPEQEIEFSQSAKSKPADVKHVKVRTSVDVMAELEALRKRATAAPKRKEVTAADVTIPTPKQKRDIHRTVNMQASPDVSARAKSVRVTVSFEGESGVVQTQEQTLELNDVADVRSLAVDLKIALE
jgi:hypothetical protein